MDLSLGFYIPLSYEAPEKVIQFLHFFSLSQQGGSVDSVREGIPSLEVPSILSGTPLLFTELCRWGCLALGRQGGILQEAPLAHAAAFDPYPCSSMPA